MRGGASLAGDAATKRDLAELEARLGSEIGRLEERVDRLEERIDGLEERLYVLQGRIGSLLKRVVGLPAGICLTLAALLLPLLLRAAGLLG